MRPLFPALLLLSLATICHAEEALADKLKGKLIKVEDGEIVEAELAGDPEYFVFYHSASW